MKRELGSKPILFVLYKCVLFFIEEEVTDNGTVSFV